MTRNRAGKIVAVLTLAALALTASGCGAGQNISPPPPPSPEITVGTLVPPYTVAGGSDFNFFVNGSGFTTSSVIQWNGTPVPTTFGTNAILTASISSSLIATPGTASITVKNSSSGTTSNVKPFGIASPATATAGVIQLITVTPDGSPANADSLVAPSINADGRYVAFQSAATNLAPGPASGYQEIYERDTCIGAPAGCVPTTIRITVTHDGAPANFHSLDSAISADGRYIAFDSEATNILPNTDVCGSFCVFLRDTCSGAPAGCNPSTTLVTVASDGSPVGGANPSISPDGRFVAFNSRHLHRCPS